MSSQIKITKEIIDYLKIFGYRKEYIIDKLIKETKKLGNVSQMQVSAEEAKFLELIVKITNSKKCLEIGRFTGLSALCLARGLPNNGTVITIDNSDEFLHIAEKYWQLAGVEKKINSVIGEGTNILKKFIKKNFFFDLIFIDADKNNYPEYYELCMNLIKKKGLIIIDNTLWGGRVANKKNIDKISKKINFLNNKILVDKRVEFSFLPFADGVSLIRKK